MTELQRQVFNTHLGDQGYLDIRSLVRDKCKCPNGLVKQGILIEGFYSLQAQLCKDLKHDVVWTMLKGKLNWTHRKIKHFSKNSIFVNNFIKHLKFSQKFKIFSKIESFFSKIDFNFSFFSKIDFNFSCFSRIDFSLVFSQNIS